jgi:shikimate dehydrogenase
MKEHKNFGLLGKNISYSFSRNYFTEKFAKLQLDTYSYENFDIPAIDEFPLVLDKNIETLQGINVTIPYKEEVIQYMDEMDADAAKIGAVNTIKVLEGGLLKGFNTDAYGFENSLKPLLHSDITGALILGTGGASKAIAFTLEKLKIPFLFVSRKPKNDHTISYDDLNEIWIKNNQLIINCTPVGTYPEIEKFPPIPYEFLTEKHVLFDLIYNPEVSAFLAKGEKRKASIKNGRQMLELQADKSWEIWNS